MSQQNIRNFCIIAHIDHGKSTLADRMLELTGTVQKRDMKAQLLDQMDLERERGITIKLAPVRMEWQHSGQKDASTSLCPVIPAEAGIQEKELDPQVKPEDDNKKVSEYDQKYILNLIDTPGHVDFQYEVSRSLAAVEGAVLLVDATQGIEAQTLSVLYSAIENDLNIIPVVNKIDLPAARPEEVSLEIMKVLGCKREEILYASGKTGEGVPAILDTIIEKVRQPQGREDAPLRALIFDSVYDPYRGVVSFVRIIDGNLNKNQKFYLMQTKSEGETLEVGYFKPKYLPHSPLLTGEIGYIITGFKEVAEARVGDTITSKENQADSPLPGYKKVLPIVFASIYCTEGDDYPALKEAIEKLKLNDASLSFEPERSDALGFGFRCGFLGLLHMDIVKERLEREYNLALVVSSPTVRYVVTKHDGEEFLVEKPGDLPEKGSVLEIKEPWVSLEVFTPKDYVGATMDVVQKKQAKFINLEYLDESRAIIRYEMPLADVIIDLYDSLKSVSKGYASMNYEMLDLRAGDLEKVDIQINGDKVDALSFITHRSRTQVEGKRIVERLKELIPRQNFEIKLQAAVGAKIIGSERISPYRKDVISGLYGGDITRKNKLLDKQKKGKKKMKQIGRVEVPSDVFIKVLRNE
jgi:GTP-binding protein LepA